MEIKDKAADEKDRRKVRIIKKLLWFAGVARNAVVVCLASVIAFYVYEDKYDPFILTGKFRFRRTDYVYYTENSKYNIYSFGLIRCHHKELIRNMTG